MKPDTATKLKALIVDLEDYIKKLSKLSSERTKDDKTPSTGVYRPSTVYNQNV